MLHQAKEVGPPLTASETDQLVELLKRVPSGFMPFDVFIQMARIVPQACVEVLPFRFTDDKVEVLLIQRDRADPYWPKMWHCPGTVIRGTDQDPYNRDAFKRIIVGELGGAITSAPIFLYPIFRHVERGPELGLVYWVNIDKDVNVGRFFDVDELPNNTIEHHREMIQRALPQVITRIAKGSDLA